MLGVAAGKVCGSVTGSQGIVRTAIRVPCVCVSVCVLLHTKYHWYGSIPAGGFLHKRLVSASGLHKGLVSAGAGPVEMRSVGLVMLVALVMLVPLVMLVALALPEE